MTVATSATPAGSLRDRRPAPLHPGPVVTWELPPEDFIFEDEPVDNIDQPRLEAALEDALTTNDRLPPNSLVATNYRIAATVNGQTVAKAPDWFFVPEIRVSRAAVQRGYIPHVQGDPLAVVMEFISETDGGEYSVYPRYPYGKWYFYERILQVPLYVIFEPDSGDLAVYRLTDNQGYQSQSVEENGRYWIEALGLYLAAWQGTRGTRTGWWLRWWDADDRLLLWGFEARDLERQRAEAAEGRAEAAEERAERLLARLRELGIDE